jgi:hypothetical protein
MNSATVNSPSLSVRSTRSLRAALRLRSGLRVPVGVHSLSLIAKDHNPHVAREVINDQKDVASSSQCSWCHRVTQVPVHELERLLGLEPQFLGKGERPLLHQHADIA